MDFGENFTHPLKNPAGVHNVADRAGKDQMAADPKKLQDALDEALKAEVGAQFHSLIAHLVEGEKPQPADEPVRVPTQAEAVANFAKMVRLIWQTYVAVSPLQDFIGGA
jgi:hypothetical protein